nr:MAG TPA: hypothetical protein [Caudoviricetes sp.]
MLKFGITPKQLLKVGEILLNSNSLGQEQAESQILDTILPQSILIKIKNDEKIKNEVLEQVFNTIFDDSGEFKSDIFDTNDKLSLLLNERDYVKHKYRAIDVLIVKKYVCLGNVEKAISYCLQSGIDANDISLLFDDRWSEKKSIESQVNEDTFFKNYFKDSQLDIDVDMPILDKEKEKDIFYDGYDIDLILNEFDIFNKSYLEYEGWLEEQMLQEKTAIGNRYTYRFTKENEIKDKDMKKTYSRLRKRYTKKENYE